MLFNKKNCDVSILVLFFQNLDDSVHHDGIKPLGDLVEKNEIRLRNHGSSKLDHALLTPAKGACFLIQPLGNKGKHIDGTLQSTCKLSLAKFQTAQAQVNFHR